MTTEATPFDPMQHLNTVADQVKLLNDALATGDHRVVINVIGMIARVRGMSQLSRTTAIGRSSLYRSTSEDGNPTLETLLKLMEGLHLRLRAEAAT